MNSDYKSFLYKKLNEVSEQKESFCELNTQLVEENKKMKEQVNKLLEEQKNIDWLEVFLLKEKVEHVEERSLNESAIQSLVTILERFARNEKDQSNFKKLIVTDLYKKYVKDSNNV